MIKSLKLVNYRNIENLDIEFNKNINILYGDNAQGKTNIVEALGYLSLLKSFRSSYNSSLIKDGADFASIEATDDKNNIYKVVITNEKRNISINQTNISRKSDFIGEIIAVTFSPENVDMFKDSPKIRREFLDDLLSLVYPSYSTYLLNFDKYRIERNNSLKEKEVNKVLIDTYDSLLADYSKVIISKRNEFIKSISNSMNKYYQSLTKTNSKLTISYESDFKDKDEKEIYELYKNSFENDLEKGLTTLGPQRDDLIIYLDNKEMSQFCSQGQNRIAVISLKLATIEFIKSKRNKDAIVILDDVLSELDESKQENLLSHLKINNQLFITTTQNIELSNCSKFKINNGKIENGGY